MAVNNDVHNCDVKVINAYKCYYGDVNIINGLNMNVKSGSIYGLLGPSGCGKSTLLQCILGVMPLDSGNIESEIQSQCDVGYMPQDICLDGKLTVKETFEYYGILYKMTTKNIKKRIDELTNILKLPNLNSYIEDLSGGESRRISLAITLLHDPKIMIMDEPTVGIDSTLRHEIWDEFKRITEQQKKTIIITTHYIEEATQADCVGLMRNGVLLEEGSPVDILLKYNSDTLESAFLTICCRAEEDNNIIRTPAANAAVTDNNGWKKPRKLPKKIIDYSRIKGLLTKNIRLFSRDYMLMFTTMVFPILQTALICACIGNDTKDLKIAIKNDENEVKDRNAGESIIKKSKYIAFIHFPKNYTSEFAKYIDDQDNYDLQLQPYMDLNTHNALFKYAMLADIMETMKYLVQSVLHSCSNNPKAFDVPLEFMTVYGKEVISYTNSIVSLYIAMGAFYFPCLFSVSVMLTEKMDGVLGRSMIAGVTKMDLVISLFSITNGLLVLQTLAPLLIAYVFFGNPIEITNGLFAFGILIILLGWSGFFYGLIVAIISPSKLAGIFIINGFTCMQSTLTGSIWPISAQTPVLQVISELLPIRIAGSTMVDISLKGWTSDHPSVVRKTAVMIFYNAMLFSVLVILGKLKKDVWLKR